MRRLKLWLLGGTALFNLLFWLLVCQQYQLKGFLLGYSNTVWVGSAALVLLAYLTACVRQIRRPLSAQALHWRSLWRARFLWVLLALEGCFLAALLVCLVEGLTPLWPGGYLFAVLTAYVGSVLLFQGVTRLLHKAALPQFVTPLATTLAVVSLGFTFAWVGAWVFYIAEGNPPSCVQRVVSPSGQRTLVLETRDDWIDGEPTGYAYVEASEWRRELPAPLNGYNACADPSLRVRWSADEKQVDWQLSKQVNWQQLNEHGQWRW